MFRGSYSFNLFNQYRVDLFVDHARGRSAESATPWLPVTGLGLGLNLRAPRNTILRVDLGRSFLPESFRGAGSTVLQIMLLKPLMSRRRRCIGHENTKRTKNFTVLRAFVSSCFRVFVAGLELMRWMTLVA